MNLASLIRAVFFPVTETGVLVPLLAFWLLLALAGFAGVFGFWLTIVIVPAVLRYQMVILEARARGTVPAPPGIEFFSWASNGWSLFPVVIAMAIAWAAYAAYSSAGTGAMLAVTAVGGFVYPAIVGVLAITHSPLQSVSPVAWSRFIRHTGISYAIAPVYLLLIVFLIPMIGSLNQIVSSLLKMFFVFSFHSVIGSVIAPAGIVDDIDIPEPVQPDDATIAQDLEANRAAALAHAYGFISRNNRAGGFSHIFSNIEQDPDPESAWHWYLERMLTWDDKTDALLFAQHCVRDLLAHGEDISAIKLIMRCRLFNEQFHPFREDLPAAIKAAEASNNIELAVVLKRV